MRFDHEMLSTLRNLNCLHPAKLYERSQENAYLQVDMEFRVFHHLLQTMKKEKIRRRVKKPSIFLAQLKHHLEYKELQVFLYYQLFHMVTIKQKELAQVVEPLWRPKVHTS